MQVVEASKKETQDTMSEVKLNTSNQKHTKKANIPNKTEDTIHQALISIPLVTTNHSIKIQPVEITFRPKTNEISHKIYNNLSNPYNKQVLDVNTKTLEISHPILRNKVKI